MKVIITGGTGFIGYNLCRRLLDRGMLTGPSGMPEEIDSIVLFDTVIPDHLPKKLDDRVSVICGDISDRDTVFALIDRDDVSVFHLASVVSSGGEKDFDLAMRVNLHGGLNILEAARARGGLPRVLFSSSVAIFGGDPLPDAASDSTKALPQTTYGMTKVVGELMVNDYTRKGFIDGRTARLPTVIIRPGKPNAAASSFCSGVFREPLHGQPCALPVDRSLRMPVIGYRTCIEGFIALHEADGSLLGNDRALNFPSLNCTVADMVAAVQRVAGTHGIDLGAITDAPNPDIQAIVSTWPTRMTADRALAIGLPRDDTLDQIIETFIEDFLRR